MATNRMPALVDADKSDRDRLTQLAHGLLASRPDLADQLLVKLGKAESGDAVLDTTIRMGSAVVFQTADGAKRRVTLVYPEDADIATGKVSILTPIGAALFGLAVGETADFTGNDGRERSLTVLDMAPEGFPLLPVEDSPAAAILGKTIAGNLTHSRQGK